MAGVIFAFGPSGCRLEVPAAQRATILAANGQAEEALVLMESHLVEVPESVEARRLAVRLSAAVGRMDRAEHHVAALARQLGDKSSAPWIEFGHALELVHRYDEALEMYDQAAIAAPMSPEGPKVGGMRAARWGELHWAEPRLSEAVKREPTDPDTWHALGLVRSQLGDQRGARVAYMSGLRSDPKSLQNRLGLAPLGLRSGDFEQAASQYDTILEARPDYAAAYLGRSWAQLQLGRYDAAEQSLLEGQARGADPAKVRAQRRQLVRAKRAGGPASSRRELDSTSPLSGDPKPPISGPSEAR